MAKTYNCYKNESDMYGPYELKDVNLKKTGLQNPGVYLLAKHASGCYRVMYVGRSGELSSRLKDWIGQYDYFYYKATKTEIGAFWTECREFHRYGKAHHLDNERHPAVPPNTNLPKCGEVGCKGEAY